MNSQHTKEYREYINNHVYPRLVEPMHIPGAPEKFLVVRKVKSMYQLHRLNDVNAFPVLIGNNYYELVHSPNKFNTDDGTWRYSIEGNVWVFLLNQRV